jgi:ribosomal protein S18 acetylase RimI-like enzyme
MTATWGPFEPARVEDAAAISELAMAVIEERPGNGELDEAKLREVLKRPSERGVVVRDAAGLVAVCLLDLEATDPRFRNGPKDANLDLLAVRPDAQRRGLGRALVQWALDEARAAGRETMTLQAMAHRAGPLEFYERIGFEAVAVLKDAFIVARCPMWCCQVFGDGFNFTRAIPPPRVPLPRSDTPPMIRPWPTERRALRVFGWSTRPRRAARAWS